MTQHCNSLLTHATTVRRCHRGAWFAIAFAAVASASPVLAQTQSDRGRQQERQSPPSDRERRSDSEQGRPGPRDAGPRGQSSAEPRGARPGEEAGRSARPGDEREPSRRPNDTQGDAERAKDGDEGPNGSLSQLPSRKRMRPEERTKRLNEFQGKNEKQLSDKDFEEFRKLRIEEDREKPVEQRRERVKVLQQRKDKGTKLSRIETEELTHESESVKRHEDLDRRYEERDKTRDNRRRESQEKLANELPRVRQDETTTRELKTHAERLAKLERARDLAEADERTDTVTKIDALITKENQRHQTWLKAHASEAK